MIRLGGGSVGPPPALFLVGLLAAVVAMMAAAPPEVVRVRAPASEIGKWFPRGTELISLKPDEFENLVAKARGTAPEVGPYLLRAAHRARWEDGRLIGRSTFTVRRDAQGKGLLPLDPWDLAADPRSGGDRPLLASDDGRAFLRLPTGGSSEVAVAWSRAAQPHSAGRSFVLDLPRVPLASLDLDLPDGLLPEGFAPGPGAPAAGRRLWRKGAATGTLEVRLRDRGEDDGSARERPWISGPSTIDVGTASATWRAEWTVEADGQGRTIRVGFSPGLEPAEAGGADVESSEIRRSGDRAEMTIRLRPETPPRTVVLLRGFAAIRPARPWPLPSAWPIDAEWLGGDVTVRLDRSRALGACRVLRGRRLPVAPEAMAERPTLLFEPTGPGPAAELTFAPEGAPRRAEVRGSVRYAPTDSTLDARLRWTTPRGRPGALAFDLPESWSIERVVAGDVPIDWHRELIGRGLARVRLAPPPFDGEAIDSEVRLRASMAAAGDGPRELPRIMPVGVAADELWVASAPADRLLVPRSAAGIAWLDPGAVAVPEAADRARGLGWRWTGEEAMAEAAIVAAPREVRSRVDGTIEIAAGRIRADWRLTIRPGPRPLSSIPLAWSDPDGAPLTWRLRGGSSPDRDLTPRAGARPPVALDLPEPTSTTIVLEATTDRPWSGRGSIPLPILPAEFHARGRVAVRVGPGLLTRIESHGLADVGDAPEDTPGRLRLDRILTYTDGEARLTIETAASRHPEASSVAACRLVTSRDPSGRSLHRLGLRFFPAAPAELAMTMPPGTELIRARQGDRSLEVIADGPRLRVPIAVGAVGPREVVLDYAESSAPADGRLRPTVPTLSVDCLHFLWTIVTPAGREVVGVGPGLVAVEPSAAPPGPFRFGPTTDAKGDDESAAVLKEIHALLSAPRSSPVRSLGVQLRALAGGDRAVVVDRVGFEEAGIGPDSLAATAPAVSEPGRLDVGPICLVVRRGISLPDSGPPREGEAPAEPGASPGSAGASPSRGKENGPAAVVIAVTPRSSDVADRWRDSSSVGIDEAIRAAAIVGESPDARWVAVEEWSGTGSAALVPAGSRRHFALNGWPGPDAWAELAPASARSVAFVLASAGLLALGLILRVMGARTRAVGLMLLTLAAYLVLWSGFGLPGGSRPGIVLGIASAWLVQPPGRRRIAPDPTGRGMGSSGRIASPVAGAVVALGLASTLSASVADPDADVILAILPYEGAPDLRAEPSRVILRLADYESLKAAAAPAPAPRAAAYAQSATHRVEVVGDRSAKIISELTLILEGEGPAAWPFPTAGAWEIRATLDGRAHPVRIGDAGGVGVVALEGPGTHRLRVERNVAVVGPPGGRAVVAPINPVPIAEVEVTASPSSVAGASRRPGPSGSWTLGPARELRVRLGRDGDEPAAAGGFHGLVLWDALPSGDRLRLRLTPSGAPAAAIRLGLDADVRVRVPDRRRMIRSGWGERAGGVVWTAAFDPPCARDNPVEIELWRPRAEAPAPRRMPRVAVEGGAFEGVVAFRRPADWSGRLDDPAGFGGRDEETFVASWGRLPDGPLTLAGAVGFRRDAEAEVDTRPVPVRRAVRSDVRFELGEGRLDLAVDAVVRDLSGQSTDLDVDLPPGLVADRVSADGLMGLSWPRPDRVHLELARVAGRTRKVTVRGHLLVDPDSALVEARHYRATTPRLRWSDATEEAGSLTLVSTSRPSAEPASGAPAVPLVESPAAGPVPSPRTYRIERPGDVAAIRWQAAPPRVGVFVQSRLAVGEDAAELDATVRYEVAGGPLDVIYLKLPTAWAEAARAQLVGDAFQRTTEARGDWTTWTIRPDHPIWGMARLRIESRRDAAPGASFAFPDLIPLGQGRVEKILSVERTTGAAIELEGSAGLQAIDPSRLDEDGPGPSDGTQVGVYRVAGEAWSLTIRPGVTGGTPPPAGQLSVREAETRCGLRPDGVAIGATTYLVDARLGRALRVRLGPRAEVLAASAGGRPLPVLATGDGVWSIPFEWSGPVEVDLLWRSATAGADGSRGEVVLPHLDRAGVPGLARISAPASVLVRPIARGLEPMTGSAWRVERAERLARRVLAVIGDFDRSSSSEEAELSALLARFALEARLAGRSASGEPGGLGEPLVRRVDRARGSIAESLDLYGLDDFRPSLDRGPAPDDRDVPATPRPLPLGRSTSFRSTSASSPDREEAIAWELRPARGSASEEAAWPWWGLAAIVAVRLPRALGVPGFRSRAGGIALALALVGVAAIAPIPGSILILAAWVGRA